MGFSKKRKKPDRRRSSNCVVKRVFSTFPIGAKRNSQKSPGCVQKAFFRKFPIGAKQKKHPCDRIPRGLFHTKILGGLFQAAQKAGLTKVVQLRSKRVFSTFPIGAKRKKHSCDRIPRGRFHTTILCGLFEAARKVGLAKVVQLRSKRVFSTFPIGAKRKNTVAIEFHKVGFIPPFWVGFSKQRKKPG